MKVTKPRAGKFRGPAVVASAAFSLLWAPQAHAFFHNSPDLEQGRAIYRAECASCHGANFSKPIDPSYPKIAGQHADYLYVALKAYQTDGNPKVGRGNAIMAGQVKHVSIFGSSFPDLTMIRMLAGLQQKNTDSLIGGVANVLEEAGITLVNSAALLKPYLPAPGTLTSRGLDASEQADVDYGRPLARQIAAMDIGQTIVVRTGPWSQWRPWRGRMRHR